MFCTFCGAKMGDGAKFCTVCGKRVPVDPSVGTVGDSYDNALAESVIGLFKTEVIKQLGPWKSMAAVEWETLRWVDCIIATGC